MFVSAACPRVWVWTSYVFFSPVKIQKSPTKPSSAALFSCCVFYHEDFILLSVSDILHFTRTWYNGLFSLIFFCFQVWVLIGFWEWRGEEGKKQIAVQMQSQISEKNFRLLVFCGWFFFWSPSCSIWFDESKCYKIILMVKKFKKCFHLLGG